MAQKLIALEAVKRAWNTNPTVASIITGFVTFGLGDVIIHSRKTEFKNLYVVIIDVSVINFCELILIQQRLHPVVKDRVVGCSNERRSSSNVV